MFSKSIFRSGLLAVLLCGAISTATAVPVIYIAGDSTVMTYKSSYNLYPQQGWGGRLPDYFTTAVTWSNRAIGGRSTKSFIDEGKLASILSVILPGDYLFIQFGHNDGNSSVALHTDPFTTYKTYLAQYIDGAVAKGAIPVLVTPVGRRNYNSSGAFINDFVDRCTAMQQLAVEKNCKIIDLNAKSIAFYNSIGAPATADVFLWLAVGQYPNFPNGVSDNTHFQEYGAGQLARLMMNGIHEINLGIKSAIATSITYPAEAAALSGTGMIREKTNAGWNGQGYVNFPTTGGTMTLNNVRAAATGTKTLRIRFALGGTATRTGQLVVNGVTTSITFNATGAFTTWATKDVSISLNSGTTNTIQLKSNGADLANVDEVTVL